MQALKGILDTLSYNPRIIHSDLGTEMTSARMGNFLKSSNIQQTFSKQSTHAYQVERFIGTIKNLLKAYRIENNTQSFVNQIPQILKTYNSRTHRTIGMAPESVNEYNSPEISERLYAKFKERTPKPYKFKVGEVVRIETNKTIFDKNDYNFSTEIFKIATRQRKDKLNIYEITSCNVKVSGFFYESELVSAHTTEEQLYHIDKIISEKTKGGKRYALVSFVGFPNNTDCNEWLLKDDIVDVN